MILETALEAGGFCSVTEDKTKAASEASGLYAPKTDSCESVSGVPGIRLAARSP